MSPAIAQFRRAEVEARIEQLIDLLDLLDGDTDLEDSADAEPYLGWTANGPQSLCNGISAHDDREDESELLEDGGDTEPNGDELDTSFAEDEFHGRFWS